MKLTDLLLLFALPEEAAPMRRRLAGWPELPRIVVTGMGRRRAANATRAALAERRPTMVLTCGFAGGLDPALAREAVLMEADADFPLAPALRRAGAQSGSFLCTDRILITPAEKAAAWTAHRCEGVEMESGEIRRICREAGIPCATVRVISDAADEALPLDFNRLADANQELSYAKLALTLLRAPGKLGELLAFQRRLRGAGARLADVLATALADREPR